MTYHPPARTIHIFLWRQSNPTTYNKSPPQKGPSTLAPSCAVGQPPRRLLQCSFISPLYRKCDFHLSLVIPPTSAGSFAKRGCERSSGDMMKFGLFWFLEESGFGLTCFSGVLTLWGGLETSVELWKTIDVTLDCGLWNTGGPPWLWGLKVAIIN